MQQPEESSLYLKEQIAELERVIRELRPKADLWDRFAKTFSGLRGEELGVRLLLAERVFGNSVFDLVADDGRRLEVKFARLTQEPNKPTVERWKWVHLLGTSGKKQYDRLLLVGESNQKFSDSYREPTSEYVIFDLSRKDVRKLRLPREGSLTINSDPARSSPRHDRLFTQFEVTISELRERYCPSATVESGSC